MDINTYILLTRDTAVKFMYNIYVIKNIVNGHQYIDYTDLPLNKKWKETLEKYEGGNSSLFNSMKHYGINRFKISVLEEYYGKDINNRLEYWVNRYDPEYNKQVIEYTNTTKTKRNIKRKWGIQKKKKPKGERAKNVIKCRDVVTGKLKTHHGWEAAAKWAGGHVQNIKQAIARDGTAYGYKWWIYKQAGDTRRRVYGVHKDGHVTPVFDSILDAMKALGGDDRGKGICTSIKWKQRWKGYMWYYSDESMN